MKNTIRFALAAAVSLVALEASAGGFAVREQSAFWQGTSFAGAATAGGGLSGMFWNPAVLGEVPGINSESHLSGIFGYAKIDPTTGTSPALITRGGSGNIAIPALVPASYGGYQINDKLTLGLSINAPFGLKTKSNYAWAGQIYGRSSKAFNTNISPTLAFKVTDWLTIGAGVQVSYFDTALKGAFGAGLGAVLPTANSAILSGDGWGIGYTLGAIIKPVAGTEIGVGFRSSVHHELHGDLMLPGVGTSQIKANVNLPEMLTFGLRQKLTQDLTLLAGYEWSNWSRLKTPAIRDRATGTQLTNLPFEYGDGNMASLGLEYRFNPSLTLRTGLAYEWSPVSDRVRSPRIPDNDRVWASIGATYNWNEKLSFDASYSHIFVQNVDVNIVSGNPHYRPPLTLVGKGSAHVDIFSLSLRYRWDNPPARAALVTKG